MRPSLIAWIVNSAPVDLLLDQHRLAAPPRRAARARSRARRSWSARCGPITFTPLPPGEAGGLDGDGRRAEGRRSPRRPRAASRTTRSARHRLGRDLAPAARARTPCSTRSPRPRASGPTARVPWASSASTTPAASGSSALTIAMSISRSRANAATARGSHTSPIAWPPPERRRVAHDRGVLVADERVQLAVLGHAHGERALAPAVADDQGAHARAVKPRRASDATARRLRQDARRRCALRGAGGDASPSETYAAVLATRDAMPITSAKTALRSSWSPAPSGDRPRQAVTVAERGDRAASQPTATSAERPCQPERPRADSGTAYDLARAAPRGRRR